MLLSEHKIKYKDSKDLTVELEFIIACDKVEGYELIKLSLENTDMQSRFKNSVTKLLKSMKKDGVIQLFVFEDELPKQEKMESVYLLNKFPYLSEIDEYDLNSVYIKF